MKDKGGKEVRDEFIIVYGLKDQGSRRSGRDEEKTQLIPNFNHETKPNVTQEMITKPNRTWDPQKALTWQ